MKHIGFSESTVMGEYARIASEQGLIKVADIQFGEPEIKTDTRWSPSMSVDDYTDYVLKNVFKLDTSVAPTIQSAQLFPQLLVKYEQYLRSVVSAQVGALSGREDRAAAHKFHSDVRKAIGNKVSEWYKLNKLPVAQSEVSFIVPAQKLYSAIVEGIAPISQEANDGGANPLTPHMQRLNSTFANLMKQYGNDQAKVRPLYNKKVDEMMKSLEKFKSNPANIPVLKQFESSARQIGIDVDKKKSSKLDIDLSKRAKGNSGGVYDVSGETGEQLIDSAHPGKMRTELTSKTDENLVETIIEQQVRDIEVANSIPKGTYAALVSLVAKLNKMGYSKQAEPLKKMIVKLNGFNMVDVELISLAMKLKDGGLKKEAVKVIRLLSKKAQGTQESVNETLPKVSGNLSSLVSSMNALGLGNNQEFAGILDELKRDLTNIQNIQAVAAMDRKTADGAQNSLKEILANLNKAQSVIVVASRSGEFTGMPGDISSVSKSIGSTISSVVAASVAVRSFAETLPQEVAQPTEQEKKKIPFIKQLLSEEKFANEWGKRFNAQLEEIREKNDVSEQYLPDEISALRAKTDGSWDELKRSLSNIVKVWRSKGKWNDFIKYIDDVMKNVNMDFKDKDSPSDTVPDVEQETKISGDRSAEDIRRYNQMIHDRALELTKWSYANSAKLIGVDLRNSGITPAQARQWRDKLYEDAFSFIRDVTPYVLDAAASPLQDLRQDFTDFVKEKYKK